MIFLTESELNLWIAWEKVLQSSFWTWTGRYLGEGDLVLMTLQTWQSVAASEEPTRRGRKCREQTELQHKGVLVVPEAGLTPWGARGTVSEEHFSSREMMEIEGVVVTVLRIVGGGGGGQSSVISTVWVFPHLPSPQSSQKAVTRSAWRSWNPGRWSVVWLS